MARLTMDRRSPRPKDPRRSAVLEYLRDERKVDDSAIARAELVAERTGQPLEQVLNQLGSLSDDDLVAAYAKTASCEVWRPRAGEVYVGPEEIGLSKEFLRRARLLPLAMTGETLSVAACDPLDDEALAGLVFATGRTVDIQVARPADWRSAFEQAFGESTPSPTPAVADTRRIEREVELVADSARDGGGGAVRLVASVFEAAIANGASDIHFEPRRNDFRIRLRIDGRLVDHQVVSADLAAPTVSRVKVIANLNLGERRLPQDGRTTFVVQGKQVDVRVATSPTVFGEGAVLRILDRTAVPLDLNAMGLTPGLSERLLEATRSPHGIFLVTGPTGSGKTTTLYGMLQTFNQSARKVLSVEDPVEYHFEHVTQTQVAPQLGLTFAAALRSFLRQDPDVILVGEIRDPETAAVAIQAAMTGHFVLASVHANSALAVVPRLLDMGVEPYQLAAGFRGAVAQRLVRKLCSVCREETTADERMVIWCRETGVPPPERSWRSVGCPHCKGAGFKGRVPILEMFLADEAMLRAIAERKPESEIAHLARQQGLQSMLHDGVSKVREGQTTFEEVVAAIHG